jgi:hypothetical protein
VRTATVIVLLALASPALAQPLPHPKSGQCSGGCAVYSGQALRGHTLSRGHRFEAYDVAGKPLGTFSTEREAADAISTQGSTES